MALSCERIVNVLDRRHGWIGEWEVEPLVYASLRPADVGRTVIYCASHGRATMPWGWAEAGTLSSWRDGLVWARFSRGDTAAACRPSDLVFAVRPRDGDLSR
jgi:hypothetical protein